MINNLVTHDLILFHSIVNNDLLSTMHLVNKCNFYDFTDKSIYLALLNNNKSIFWYLLSKYNEIELSINNSPSYKILFLLKKIKKLI